MRICKRAKAVCRMRGKNQIPFVTYALCKWLFETRWLTHIFKPYRDRIGREVKRGFVFFSALRYTYPTTNDLGYCTEYSLGPAAFLILFVDVIKMNLKNQSWHKEHVFFWPLETRSPVAALLTVGIVLPWTQMVLSTLLTTRSPRR